MKDDAARDKAIEKLVAGRLRAQLNEQAPNCPDAETLAAYVERTLGPGERLTWEAHFANCFRCQEQVAQLVRLSEAEEPAEVPAGAEARGWGARITGFHWAWAATALVAVVIAGLWYTGEFRQGLQPSQETALKAPAPASSPAPTLRESTKTKALAVPPTPRAQDEFANVQGLKKEREEMACRGEPAAPNTSVVLSKKPESGSAGTGVGAGQGAIATPSERVKLAAGAAAPSRQLESSLKDKAGRMAAHAEAPTPPAPAALQPAPEEAADKMSAPRVEAKGKAAALAPLNAPLRAARAVAEKVPMFEKAGNWRVGPQGLIQRFDGKRNWVTQTSGVETDLLDITFPSPSIGWAVGQAGTILRTTNGGITWSKIPSPTGDDLVRVTARDGLVARVVTRGGQVLATTDGGNSWSALPEK